MNDELKELIRVIITKGNLNNNLVLLTYEVDNDSTLEKLERLSTVYEVKSVKEGFD